LKHAAIIPRKNCGKLLEYFSTRPTKATSKRIRPLSHNHLPPLQHAPTLNGSSAGVHHFATPWPFWRHGPLRPSVRIMGHQRDIGRWDATGVEADVGARTGGHVLQGKNPFSFLASQKLGEVAYGLNMVK